MANNVPTKAQEVYDAFESTFSDRVEVPESLELQWLKMAVGRYNEEIAIDPEDELIFDSQYGLFSKPLDQYVISTLGQMIRQLYQEREYSRVNKIASVVGKDLSINGQGNLSKYSKDELSYHSSKLSDMIGNQKPTAMS